MADKYKPSDFTNQYQNLQKKKVKPGAKVRQTPLTPERHAKLLKDEAAIHGAANSDWGKGITRRQNDEYNAARATWKSVTPAKKEAPAMAAPVTPAAAPAAKKRQPPKLSSMAHIQNDNEGQYVMRGQSKHRPPDGGKEFSSEHKAKFNYGNTGEVASYKGNKKKERADKLAARDKNPGFNTSSEGAHTTVKWDSKTEKSPASAKPVSAAKAHAIEMTSSGVKGAIHKAAGAKPAAPASYTSQGVKDLIRNSNPSSKQVTEAKAPEPAPSSGRSPEPVSSGPHPVASKSQFSSNISETRPQLPVKETRAQPAVNGNSSRSWQDHVDDAISVANSGRVKPPAQNAKVPAKSDARTNSSNHAVTNASSRFSGSTGDSPNPFKASRETPKSKPGYVESPAVDSVSGLAPSRATRKAVKAARNYDSTAQTHEAHSENRQRKLADNASVREASKPQGPLGRLVNGPKQKPENKMGPVEHVARKAALNIGQGLENRKLGKVAGKFDKAKAKAEQHHDEIRAGSRRGSNTDLGAVGAAAGRVAVKAAKGLGNAVYEGSKDIAKAEVTGVKRIAGRVQQGRTSQPPASNVNRNVQPRQFYPGPSAGSRPGDPTATLPKKILDKGPAPTPKPVSSARRLGVYVPAPKSSGEKRRIDVSHE